MTRCNAMKSSIFNEGNDQNIIANNNIIRVFSILHDVIFSVCGLSSMSVIRTPIFENCTIEHMKILYF